MAWRARKSKILIVDIFVSVPKRMDARDPTSKLQLGGAHDIWRIPAVSTRKPVFKSHGNSADIQGDDSQSTSNLKPTWGIPAMKMAHVRICEKKTSYIYMYMYTYIYIYIT